MKRFRAISLWAILMGIGGGLSALAQQSWVPVGPPPWTNVMFQTVGGITYFTHRSWVKICHRVHAFPVAPAGTNFLQVINYEQYNGPCVLCECYGMETHVSVLGALASGDYDLQVWSWNPQLLGNVQYTNLLFHVPSPNVPTLSCLPPTNGGSFQLAVLGIPNVEYVIETSSTLADWTPIATNKGGPFVWNPSPPPRTNCFYRARIIGD
jgi:hypothetical protein